MKLNKGKSAVVEFIPRRTHSRFIIGSQIMGIPIQDKYKYLGLWLNRKLTLDDQIEHIRKKSDFIKVKLGPVLSVCSLGYRKNLWELFIRPLFEFTLPINYFERASSRKEELKRVLKHTFKGFTKLSKTVPDSLINSLCGYDIAVRGGRNHSGAGSQVDKQS